MLDMIIGGAAVAGAYVLYRGLVKIPAVYTGVKTWWTKADAEVKAILTDLQGRVTTLEGKVGIAPTAPAAAPAAPAAPTA